MSLALSCPSTPDHPMYAFLPDFSILLLKKLWNIEIDIERQDQLYKTFPRHCFPARLLSSSQSSPSSFPFLVSLHQVHWLLSPEILSTLVTVWFQPAIFYLASVPAMKLSLLMVCGHVFVLVHQGARSRFASSVRAYPNTTLWNGTELSFGFTLHGTSTARTTERRKTSFAYLL